MKLILPLIVTCFWEPTRQWGSRLCCIDFGDPYCFETDAEDCALQGGVYYGMAAAARPTLQIACRHTARAASAVWNVLRPTNLTASIPVAILRAKLHLR